jgi:hypothetical protein
MGSRGDYESEKGCFDDRYVPPLNLSRNEGLMSREKMRLRRVSRLF